MKYCIVTPIGPQKQYARDLFWGGIDNLTQQPTQIYFYSKKNVHNHWMKGRKQDNITWCQEPEETKTRTLQAVTVGRETLRQKYLEESVAEWVLLLDPDIIPEPHIIDKFEVFLETHPKLVVLRAFHPSRSDHSTIRHGISCTFAHRDAMAAYPFSMGQIRGIWTGDDLIWIAVMGLLGRRRGIEVLAGFYFDIKHAHEDGRIKEFDEEHKRKLQC